MVPKGHGEALGLQYLRSARKLVVFWVEMVSQSVELEMGSWMEVWNQWECPRSFELRFVFQHRLDLECVLEKPQVVLKHN